MRKDIRLGLYCFKPITRALIELGRADEAATFVSRYHARLENPVAGLHDRERNALLATLTQCWKEVEAANLKKNAGNTDETSDQNATDSE